MENCLYKNYNTNTYYLIDSVASYFALAIDLETFKQQFIQKDVIEKEFEHIRFNSTNILEVLYKYDMFQNQIDMCDFRDFDYIVFDLQRYYLRNWRDVYDFIVSH
jgi:hypothetical protein